MPDQSEWNFIFLIYADLTVPATEPDSDSEKFNKLKEVIKRLTLIKNCNLFTIKNTIVINNVVDVIINQDQFDCAQHAGGVERKLFERMIAQRMDEKPRIIGHYIRQIGEGFPSKKTILFTWDHGNIFGINKVPDKIKERPLFDFKTGSIDFFPDYNFSINPLVYRRTNGLDKDRFLEGILKGVRNPSPSLSRFIGNQSRKFDEVLEPEVTMLTNEMLAESLVIGGFNNDKKMDVVCMMNCCMQNLHTQFALKDTVQFLVAPETWIYFPGYDYESIFNSISQNKPESFDAKTLAYQIVETCKNDSSRAEPVVKRIQSQGVFAINLRHIQTVADDLIVNIEFDTTRSKNDPLHKEALARLPQYSFREFEDVEFVNYRLVDLNEIFLKRSSLTSRNYSQAMIKSSCDLFNLFGKDKQYFIGSNVVKPAGKEITGLCMSFPKYETYKNPNELFIQLFYKPSKYQSKLVAHLKMDVFFDTIFS